MASHHCSQAHITGSQAHITNMTLVEIVVDLIKIKINLLTLSPPLDYKTSAIPLCHRGRYL